jgi:1-acyl-sn-glycerol-3-phosphate acyltransferase
VIIWKPDGFRFWLTFWVQRLFMLPLVWLVFRVFNHLTIEGLEHLDELDETLGENASIILAPNHTTAFDGFVATIWALSHRKRFIQRRSYTAVLAAPENIPASLGLLVSTLGGIPVDRDLGVDQFALNDVARLFHEGRSKIVLTVYPEGTRSKNGRLRRRGRPGIGWIQRQTGATVVPIYHSGGTKMPGMGQRMKIRIGKPLPLQRWQDEPNELGTWRGITGEVMDSLRAMERDALDRDPDAQPPRRERRRRLRWRRASRRQESQRARSLTSSGRE